MERTWTVSTSPHLRSPESIPRIMWQVVAALIPAGFWAVYAFGAGALRVIALSVVAAVAAEALLQRLRGGKVTVSDGSAFLTGLLLAYCLPAYTTAASAAGGEGVAPLPWFVPVVGAVVAIAIAKQAFGGLGGNIWNPALVGRAFVQVAWPSHVSLTQWPSPRGVDAVTQATPLTALKGALATGSAQVGGLVTWRGVGDLFLGKVAGSLGEVSALLLLLGGAYLIARGYVDWRLPLSYLAVVFVGALLYGALRYHVPQGDLPRLGLYHLFAGGVMLGAFFMATDMVTTPLTRRGQVIFGLGCGVLTVLIRFARGYPEGVCYSILLMNTATPLIDRHTRPRVFGSRTRKAEDSP